MMKTLFLLFLFWGTYFTGTAQSKSVYQFWKDDTLARSNYFKQAQEDQTLLLASITTTNKEEKKDYKEAYEDRFEELTNILRSNSVVTETDVNNYLQSLFKKITDANPEIRSLKMRLLFSRDDIPNAYSIGEGTLIVNAGLMIFLKNEAELVFVICHEISHYYLDHGNLAIKKDVEKVNSKEFKEELKKLKKEKYGVGQKIDDLVKNLTFDNRKHSRTYETDADRQAFVFMKKTGYDCNAITTCLQMLDNIDDSINFKRLNVEEVFSFAEYPFKKRWIEKESAIMGQLTEYDSPLTKKEKDSLKTHPDCVIRIAALEPEIKMIPKGSEFLVNGPYFNELKKAFYYEMLEQEYKEDNLSANLYHALLLLQSGENDPLAIYSIARTLNNIFEAQKNHTVGKKISKEWRGDASDLKLLLRMLDRLKLAEIVNINYFFCKKYEAKMIGYTEFDKEIAKATEYKNEF